jgi:O-antigen ligase
VRLVAVALAAFFTVVQFYTSLAGLSPTPPVGYLFVSPAGAALLVAILVASGVAILARLVRERAGPSAECVAVSAPWIGAAALASALGLYPAAGFQVVGVMLLTALFAAGLVRYWPAPGVARAVVRTYLWAGFASAVAALAMVLARRPAELWALNHGRAAGLFVTANQLAAFLIAFVFVALGAALAGGPGLRRLGFASAAAGAVALAATVSVAGLLGTAVAGALYARWLGARRTAAALAALTLAGVVLFALRPAVRHNPAESLDRLRIWQAGLRVAELFPLTGAGPMAYFKVYPAIRPANGDLPGTFGALHPHDVYLSLAGETGVAGLLAAAFGWLAFVRGFRARVSALDEPGRRFAFATAAALVAVLVQGLFDTVGVVEVAFVWIPYTGLALAAAGSGLPASRPGAPA